MNVKFIVFSAFSFFCLISRVEAFPIKRYTVPVKINIYNNAVTPERARMAVEEANKLFEQNNTAIKLHVAKIQKITASDGAPDNPHGGDNDSGSVGDGRFTDDERDKVREFGGKELKKVLKNEKGLKISFANDAEIGSPPTQGIAIHNNRTIILEDVLDANGGVQRIGKIIAHEAGHVWTINGHSPGADEIMNEFASGSRFTSSQIREMEKAVDKYHGKCSVQIDRLTPAIKCSQQFGGTTDTYGDQTGILPAPSEIYDLQQVFMAGLHPSDQTGGDIENISALLTVGGVFPDSGQIEAAYGLGFDIDADLRTGVEYAGYEGIDRIVYINALGDISLGTFGLSQAILNPLTGMLTFPSEIPSFVIDNMFHEFTGIVEQAATTIEFNIPKNQLSLSDLEVPVVATAGLSGLLEDYTDDIIFDVTDDLTFDPLRFLKDPTLTTFGNGVPQPGLPYMFGVSGLVPNDVFNLYLDDDIVFTDVLDNLGSFLGEFIFPSDVSNLTPHFLIAQDTTGEFAYSHTCPCPSVPEPNSIPSILVIGSLGTASILKRKIKPSKEKELEKIGEL